MNFLKNVLMVFMVPIAVFSQGSVDSINPFSQYLNPASGVSLFTGNVSFSQPLITLTAKGGISLPIQLQYSSNVDIAAQARNDILPTSWVGLGWGMVFGRIICNHNGTMQIADDEYTWVSPTGDNYPIYQSDGQYIIEDYPSPISYPDPPLSPPPPMPTSAADRGRLTSARVHASAVAAAASFASVLPTQLSIDRPAGHELQRAPAFSAPVPAS